MAPELFITLYALVFAMVFLPITRRFFNFVQFHLLYKVVKTQETFVRIAKKRGVRSVVVDLVQYPSCIYDPPPIMNVIGDSTYTLEITAEVSRGRPVVYQEFPFKRFGSSHGFADAEDRGKAAMKLMLLGEKKVQELQEHFPRIQVTLHGQRGPVDENVLAKLRRDARSAGITV